MRCAPSVTRGLDRSGAVADAPAALVVVDTSVAVKWLSADGEDGVAEALEVLEAHHAGRTTICAPALLPIELVSALMWKGVDADGLAAAAGVVEDLRLALFAPDAELLGEAARIAVRERLTIYDALFVALAAELGCAIVTADARQARTRSCPARLLRAGD